MPSKLLINLHTTLFKNPNNNGKELKRKNNYNEE